MQSNEKLNPKSSPIATPEQFIYYNRFIIIKYLLYAMNSKNINKSKAPIFVLCMSRSGSTLTRYILDTHPKIACPPELHIGSLLSKLQWVYLHTAKLNHHQDTKQIQTYLQHKLQQNISGIMGDFLKQSRKKIWCDKSVFTIDHLDIIKFVYPSARYICLYRNAYDQIASSQETFSHIPTNDTEDPYGFAEYINKAKDSVNGLADYWLAKVNTIYNFQKDNPEQSISIKYEDIVNDSDATVKRLFSFLQLSYPEGLLDDVFKVQRPPGAGDHKIHSTNKIQSNSVGRASRYTTIGLTAERAAKIESMHSDLGYQLDQAIPADTKIRERKSNSATQDEASELAMA